MELYNFWADLLASYRASPDLVKAMWLLVPLAIALGFAALAIGVALRLTEPHRRARPRKEERPRQFDTWEPHPPPLIPLSGPAGVEPFASTRPSDSRTRGEGGSSDADDSLSPLTGRGQG